MNKTQPDTYFYVRPKIVTFIGVFQIIIALIGLVLTFFGTWIRLMLIEVTLVDKPDIQQVQIVLAFIIALIHIGLNLALIGIARAFLRGRIWARKTLAVLSFIALVTNLGTILYQKHPGFTLIGCVVQGLIFALVAYSGEVKLFFELANPADRKGAR